MSLCCFIMIGKGIDSLDTFLGSVFLRFGPLWATAGCGSCFFWFVVITKRKLKTNGYTLHIKQLFFFSSPCRFLLLLLLFLVVFVFGLFTSWRKINCATGATMSTTGSKTGEKEKKKKKTKEKKREEKRRKPTLTTESEEAPR